MSTPSHPAHPDSELPESVRPTFMTLDSERAEDVIQLRAMLQINGVVGVLTMLRDALALEPGVDIV